jgi:hypothetical protein
MLVARAVTPLQRTGTNHRLAAPAERRGGFGTCGSGAGHYLARLRLKDRTQIAAKALADVHRGPRLASGCQGSNLSDQTRRPTHTTLDRLPDHPGPPVPHRTRAAGRVANPRSLTKGRQPTQSTEAEHRPRNAASASVGHGVSSLRAGAPAQPAPCDLLLST